MVFYAKVPEVDFSPLATLPNIYEEARLRGARQSLGELEDTSIDSMRKYANRLIATGGLKEMEVGTRLLHSATEREAIASRERIGTQQMRAYEKFMEKHGAWRPPPQSEAEPPPLPQGGTYPGRIQAPAFTPPPGPQTALPPSPSEELLARAEAGLQAPPERGPQFAEVGVRPSQGVSVPTGTLQRTPTGEPFYGPGGRGSPVEGTPAWMQGAQMAPATTLPPGGAAPQGSIYGPIGQGTPSQQRARAEAAQLADKLATYPPVLRNSPAAQADMAQLRDANARAGMSQKQEDYELSRIQRRQEGLQDWSMADFEREKNIGPKRFEEAQNVYLSQEKKAENTAELIGTLNRMDAIIKDPDFKSGNYAPRYAEIVNGLNSLVQISGIAGWTPEIIARKVREAGAPHLRSAALIDEFTSLSNASLMQHVGSFSKAFSDADRAFTERIFPQILQTPGGISAIIKNLRVMANHTRGSAKAAREYMNTREGRAAPGGVYDAVEKYANDHPLFTKQTGGLTDAGRKLLLDAGGRLIIGPRGEKAIRYNDQSYPVD